MCWGPHASEVADLMIEAEFLPAYAPALNVVEQGWRHTKDSEMAKSSPRMGMTWPKKPLTRCWRNTSAQTSFGPSFSMHSCSYEVFY